MWGGGELFNRAQLFFSPNYKSFNAKALARHHRGFSAKPTLNSFEKFIGLGVIEDVPCDQITDKTRRSRPRN